MSEATLSLAVVLKDGASSGLGALGLSLGGLAGSAYMLSRAWGALSPTTKALGVTAGVTGLAFGGLAELLKSSVNAAGQLDYELMRVRISVNGAADAGDKLTTTLIHIADTSIYTTAQVADAFTQLGIDGWNASQIMDGLGQTTIDFAEAAQTQTVPAALLLGSAMKMFGASAQDATRYADDLTFAMYNGQKSATNLQQAINQVGPVAHELGVNFDELAVALAFMGEKGYYGTRAGTALRYMLAGLLDPTTKAKKEMKDLGLATFDTAGNLISSKFFDAKGNFLGLANAVDVLGQSLDKLNPQQRAAALANMFSVRGGQGALLLLQNYQQTLSQFGDLSGIEKTTSDTSKAAAVTDTFSGALTRLKTTWNDTKASLGLADLGPLKTVFNSIAGELDKFNTANPAVKTFAGTLLVMATAGSGVLFAASSLGFMVRAAKELGVLKELGKVGDGFSNLLSPLGRLSSAGRTAGEALTHNFIPALKSLPGLLAGLPGQLSNLAASGFGSLLNIPNRLLATWQTIPGLFARVGPAFVSAIPSAIGLAGALLPIITIALLVGGGIAIIVLLFTKFHAQGMQIVNMLKAVFGPALTSIKQTFQQVWSQIQQVWNQIQPQLSDGIKQMTAAFLGMRPTFELIAKVFQISMQIIITVLGVLVKAFLVALPHIAHIFTGVFEVIGGITKLIIAIFTGKWGSIPGIIGGILHGALGIITGLVGSFLGAGGQIVGGLLNGLQAAGGAVLNWVKGLAGNVLHSVLGIFGIHSPSTVMHEIGTHISNGLALGIRSVDVTGQAAKHWGSIVSAVPSARASLTVGASLSAAAASSAANGGIGTTTVNLNIDGKQVAQVTLDRLTGTLKQNGAGRLFR